MAPGTGLISTVPVGSAPSGISADAPGAGTGLVDANGEVQGTSFATPQVAGAAALLFALRPDLTASQVVRLLAASARDVNRPGRDAATGPGELDVAAAVARVAGGVVPVSDELEPNDDAGALARGLPRDQRVVRATADRYEDSLDVYRVSLRAGERLDARLRGPEGAEFDLLVFTPGGGSIARLGHAATQRLVAGSLGARSNERVRYRAARAGVYHVAVWAARGSGAYELVVRRG